MNRRLPLLVCFAAAFACAPVRATTASTAATRTAFLQLIARPPVPLAPALQPPAEKDGLVHLAFTYAADADQRVPAVLLQSASPAASGRRPVVISLHGTGGHKEGQIKLLTQFASAGFIGVAIDGRYHGARAKTPKGTGDYTAAILRAYRADEPHEHPFYYDTVRDVMRLIDYLVTRDDVDPARIGLIGFSKGGTEAYLAAAADPRIAATVACIGVQSFRWALDHDSWQSRISTIQAAVDAAAQDAGVTTVDAAFIRRFYDRTNPGIYDRFDGPRHAPAHRSAPLPRNQRRHRSPHARPRPRALRHRRPRCLPRRRRRGKLHPHDPAENRPQSEPRVPARRPRMARAPTAAVNRGAAGPSRPSNPRPPHARAIAARPRAPLPGTQLVPRRKLSVRG
jgi:dienelactone hydrolase